MRMLMKYRVLFLVLLLLAVVGCKQGAVSSDPGFKQAVRYYEQGEFEKSFELMLKSAQNGDTEAQYGVAHYYINGIGVKRNVQSAAVWYEKAAVNGHVDSMYNLGSMYLGELNVNCSKAKHWLDKAVENGSGRAMLMLSNIYKDGCCGYYDLPLSEYYLQELYKKDPKSAKIVTAKKLFWGDGVNKNYKKALSMVKDSYYEYPSDVAYMYGVAYSNGYGVEKNKSIAFKHFKYAAMNGNIRSQYNVGIYLYNGIGVQVDKDEAMKWISVAASKQHKKALTFMGYMYETGELVGKDVNKAKEYYRKAVELGDERAQKRLDKLK